MARNCLNLLFGLAPSRVYNANFIAKIPVSSYLAISPLPKIVLYNSITNMIHIKVFCFGGILSVALSLNVRCILFRKVELCIATKNKTNEINKYICIQITFARRYLVLCFYGVRTFLMLI